MTRRTSLSPLALGLTIVVLNAGCTQGTGDLEQFVAEVKQRPARPIEPMPEIKIYEPFTYTAFDLRDPFTAPKAALQDKGSGLRPDTDRRKEPLEFYPLDGLSMMGILEKDKRTLALIRSSDGLIHQVAVGNHAGQNYGRITSIQEDRVDLIEIVPDGAGGWIERPASIAIREETQGNLP
ncbi:MAG: pilus assembly protein PilP [Halothiobacillaceae bacterium]